MSKTDVIEVLDKVPESVLGVKRQSDVMMNAQESALSALWDTPEEDEAWALVAGDVVSVCKKVGAVNSATLTNIRKMP
ncbi:hypothetical protein AGMMS49965_08460 [Bacteroidia bacterium]|nr:hypothetical protein AGMMS49965_08460 [Bacteroidia bacterium]